MMNKAIHNDDDECTFYYDLIFRKTRVNLDIKIARCANYLLP